MNNLLLLGFYSLILSTPFSFSKPHTSLRRGSSFSVEKPRDVLVSPNGIFSAGFHPVGSNAYCFAIWFNEPSCPSGCTVVWMSNRDRPVNGRRSELSLRETGNLVLTDAGNVAWATSTFSLSATTLHLEDTGNLVLDIAEGATLWQSFHSPTDTLLPQQPLTRDTQLVSSRSHYNYSSGFYKLSFDDDNVLRLLYDGPRLSSVFWPDHRLLPWEASRSSYNSTRIALLDSFGKFTSSDNLTFLSADYGAIYQRRLTLDFDGNLRLYSRENNKGSWAVTWQAFAEACRVNGLCGNNSLCSQVPSQGRKCSCLPGFKVKNHTDWSYGCEPEFEVSCANTEATTFLRLPHVQVYGYDLAIYPNYTLQKCKEVCLQSCDCQGFEISYRFSNHPNTVPHCFPKIQLLHGYIAPSMEATLYMKVPKNRNFTNNWPDKGINLNCSAKAVKQLERNYVKKHGTWSIKFLIWFLGAIGLVEIFGIFLVCFFLVRTKQNGDESSRDYLLASTCFKRFTYSELKKATRNFREEIGRGAGGIVYKGTLSDDRIAAIKRLNDAKQGEAEFLAEIGTIGKLNHMHLIEMWGYCVEGEHRLLVYEYMERGSLAENISSKDLDWKKRFEIAVGTAKGLAYLHEECLEWVLHCDVKPQNILLNSDYLPKVSDFGLSRLLNRSELENPSFSRIRGTRGYMAPEWVFNQPITSKVDVYSYGIVVLEMLTGKNPSMEVKAAERREEVDEHLNLVAWIRRKRSGSNGKASWVEEIIDPIMGTEYNVDELESLVSVALQCVEEDKDARPTMGRVVELLLNLEDDLK
uniref:Receptor-like serine/threonine-protein kinase n=1 Tax=Rhizophora mucronata TaxID=61149 RepID=A0A2P2MQG3_RHIMU